MMRKVWKVFLKDGSFTMVRLAGKNVSFRQCIEILDFWGYEIEEIKSLEQQWEVAYE